MQRPFKMKIVLSLATSLALASCASVGPDYKAPPILKGDQPARPYSSLKDSVFDTNEPPSEWWKLFQNPSLDSAVSEAILANTDLRVALANLERAEAIVRESKNNRLPTTSIDASLTHGVASAAAQNRAVPFDASRNYDAGFSLAYDPDLFGRLKRAIESASADAEATAGSYDLARINVIANTTRAYADSCSAGRQIEVANESLAMQQKSFKLTNQNVKAGRGTRLDITRAESQLAVIRATVPALRAQQKNALFRLATLMGREPANYPQEAEACKTPLSASGNLPVGDGKSLIARRPDIRVAERRLASATAAVGVATAALYPSISFGASVGTTAHHLDNLDEQAAYRYSIGPILRWSFPNTTVARTRIAQAEAGTKAALANFDASILAALRDAETALSAYSFELDRNKELRSARDLNLSSVDAARRLLEAGAGSFFEVLDAERSLVSSDANLAASDATLASYRVNLYLALGGGWETSKN